MGTTSAGDLGDFSYDVGTTLGMVRFLVADTDIDSHDFADSEINATLTLVGGSTYRAAAMLYRTLAGNSARLAVRVQRGPVTEDLTVKAKELRAQADAYDAAADEMDDDGIPQAIISPSYERFSRQRNEDLGRHGDPLDWETVDDVVTP